MSSKIDTTRRRRSPRKAKKARGFSCPALSLIHEKRLASHVAREIGTIERSAVSMWKRVPAQHVRRVGEILNIAKHRIRPDLYGKR